VAAGVRVMTGRAVRVVVFMQALSLIAVCTAPRASAAANTMVLNFTGLRDTYGVPIGDYYLSIASVAEQIIGGGPGMGINPASWMAWTVHAMTVLASFFTQAAILTTEAGAFVGIVAIALWVMKITVSTYWLTVIGDIARTVAGAVVHVTTQLGLLMLAIPIGVFCGVVTVRRGEVGRGFTMILIALTMPALSVAVFADPAGEMYGPDGILAFGRRVGFSVAEAAVHNRALGGVGYAGQVDSLTASLITHTVREPLQLWNFGHVVDGVGGCGQAWSAAVRTGVPDAPIHAMGSCGDRAAMAYAEHLDGANVWVGFVFVIAALLLGFFMVVSGWAVLKVSVKAIWTTVILLPSLWLGSIPGAPQRHAMEVMWQFFRHGIEVLVYIVYVSVIGLAIERLVSRPLPAELGGNNPFAHVLMMGAAAIGAFILLRHIRTDLSGRPAGRGMGGRVADMGLEVVMQAAFGAAGSAAVGGAKGLHARLRSREYAPWEQLDVAANDARQIHGDPQPGYDPVPGGGENREAGGAPVTGGPGGDGTPPGGGGGPETLPGANPPSVLSRALGTDAPPVPPISEGIESDALADVAIPSAGEPPPDDEPPPPADNDGPTSPPPTTVNPVTEI
jgi:hypothetical protein